MTSSSRLTAAVLSGAALLSFAWSSLAQAQSQSSDPISLPAPTGPSAELTMMDPERPVECYQDTQGAIWRVQCNDATKRCLYAPNRELDATGAAADPLDRARSCQMMPELLTRERFTAAGYELVRGLPDAPAGWMRDPRGRLFQIDFDLKRRLWLGVSYAPVLRTGEAESESSRLALDVGLFSYERTLGNTRHRLRLVEGEVFLDTSFTGRIVFAHYDISRRYTEPLLRVTTFFGRPRRSDYGFDLGAWLELGDVEIHSNELGDERLFRVITGHATADLWHSGDMSSFVRIRGGVGLEGLSSEGIDDERGEEPRGAVTPGAAFEADLGLDRRGFHRLAAEISYENPLYFERHPVLGSASERFLAQLEYELIALAINDQPLSLYLSARAFHRDDLTVVPSGWTAEAKAGLRFSLWAPPRIR